MTFKLDFHTAHEFIGRLFAEFAAAIGEGFCPNCHTPWPTSIGRPGWISGWCEPCNERWEWFANPPGIAVFWSEGTESYHLHAYAPEVYEQLEGATP